MQYVCKWRKNKEDIKCITQNIYEEISNVYQFKSEQKLVVASLALTCSLKVYKYLTNLGDNGLVST